MDVLAVRADSAFFQRDFLEACNRIGVEYALKVPMWHYLNLRALVRSVDQSLWQTVSRAAQVEGIFLRLEIPLLEPRRAHRHRPGGRREPDSRG